MSVENANPVYGFSLPKQDQSELRRICQERYGIPSTQYMRIIVQAIIEDRLTIEKPNNQKEIFK